MVTLNLTYGRKGRVELQTMTEPLTSLLPSINSPDLYRSQERPLAKVGWTCPPQFTPWRRPCMAVIGTAQLVAHEAGDSILCCEGSDALFSNDFGEDLLSSS